jgi:hypothetical protein
MSVALRGVIERGPQITGECAAIPFGVREQILGNLRDAYPQTTQPAGDMNSAQPLTYLR